MRDKYETTLQILNFVVDIVWLYQSLVNMVLDDFHGKAELRLHHLRRLHCLRCDHCAKEPVASNASTCQQYGR